MIRPEDFFKFADKIKDEDLRQDCYLEICRLSRGFKGSAFDFEKYINKTLFFKKKTYYKKKNKRKKLLSYIEDFVKDKTGALALLEETPEDRLQFNSRMEFIDVDGLERELEFKIKLQLLKSNISDKDFKVLNLFHGEGYTAKEILRKHPELNIKNLNQIYNIVYKYKNYEAQQNRSSKANQARA